MKIKVLVMAEILFFAGLIALAPSITKAQDNQKTVPISAETASVAEEVNKPASYIRQGNFLILMYHDVSSKPPESKEHKQFTTTGEKFAADIDALLELGYVPISLEDYYFGRAQVGQKYFAITFDDGYKGVYDIAYPVLLEKQIPGAVFFNTGMENRETFLKFAQIQEMEQSGLVKIYSHLSYHMRSTEISVADFVLYLDSSVKKLTQYLGEKSMFFAYPFGAYNQDVYLAARERGMCLQFVQKMSFPAEDVLVRVNVEYETDMAKLVKWAAHN